MRQSRREADKITNKAARRIDQNHEKIGYTDNIY